MAPYNPYTAKLQVFNYFLSDVSVDAVRLKSWFWRTLCIYMNNIERDSLVYNSNFEGHCLKSYGFHVQGKSISKKCILSLVLLWKRLNFWHSFWFWRLISETIYKELSNNFLKTPDKLTVMKKKFPMFFISVVSNIRTYKKKKKSPGPNYILSHERFKHSPLRSCQHFKWAEVWTLAGLFQHLDSFLIQPVCCRWSVSQALAVR